MEAKLVYCRKKLGPQFEACVLLDGSPVVFPVDARYRDRFRDDHTFHRWIERTAVAFKEKSNG